MWHPNLKIRWALPVLAALPAAAARPSRWPLVQLTRMADPGGTLRDLQPTLVIQMTKGAAGALGLFFTEPAFNREGLATRSPDELLADLSRPIPLKFTDGHLWLVFYPTPASEMKVQFHAQVAGKDTNAGFFEIASSKKGLAHIQTYAFDANFILEDAGAILNQMMESELKHLPLTVKL